VPERPDHASWTRADRPLGVHLPMASRVAASYLKATREAIGS